MASNTPNLDLYKKHPEQDKNDTFNIDTMLNENWDKIDLAMINKEDKIPGKGLSSNDFTNEEKLKLESLEEGANNYQHPISHSASMIDEETNKKFMTSAEKSKLSEIEEGATNYQHPTSHPASMIDEDANRKFMTSTEKSKLAGIEAGATNYHHPASHSAGMITQDGTHRFVTDIEKNTWNAKPSTQRAVSDSVTSTSSTTAASSKAVKFSYDKGVQALNMANAATNIFQSGYTNLSGTISENSSVTLNITLNNSNYRMGHLGIIDGSGTGGVATTTGIDTTFNTSSFSGIRSSGSNTRAFSSRGGTQIENTLAGIFSNSIVFKFVRLSGSTIQIGLLNTFSSSQSYNLGFTWQVWG